MRNGLGVWLWFGLVGFCQIASLRIHKNKLQNNISLRRVSWQRSSWNLKLKIQYLAEIFVVNFDKDLNVILTIETSIQRLNDSRIKNIRDLSLNLIDWLILYWKRKKMESDKHYCSDIVIVIRIIIINRKKKKKNIWFIVIRCTNFLIFCPTTKRVANFIFYYTDK